MTVRVVLADDQALLRATFRLLLDSSPHIEVVGEAADGAQAVALARSTLADVVVMDLRMPVMDGIEATRLITADDSLAGVRVLVLTTFETDELVIEALQAGASGFLGKGVDAGALLEAIVTVAEGDQLLSPAATRALIERVVRPSGTTSSSPAAPSRELAAAIESLTVREREITLLVAAGLSNTEIAGQLFISPATVKTHVNRAMMKTSARDRAQLVVHAYESGLMQPRA